MMATVQRCEQQPWLGPVREEALRLAADLDVQYGVDGLRWPDHVRRVDPPVPVEKVWQPAGFMNAWVFENGTSVGRARGSGDRVMWILQPEPCRAEQF